MAINPTNFNLYSIAAVQEDGSTLLIYKERMTGELFKAPVGGPFLIHEEGDEEYGYTCYVRWSDTRKSELLNELAGPIPQSLIEECNLHNAIQWESFPVTYTVTEQYEGDGYRPGTRYSQSTREGFFFYDPNQVVLGPSEREGLKGWVRDTSKPFLRSAKEEHERKFESKVHKALLQEGIAYLSQFLVKKEVTPEEEFCLQWKHFRVEVDGVVHYLAVTPGYRESSNEFPTTFEVGLFHAPKGWKARRKTAVKTFGFIRYGDALLTEPECSVQYKAQVDALWEKAIQELTRPRPKLTSSGKPLPIKKK